MHDLQLGAARVHVFNVYDLRADLADWLRLPPEAWSPDYAAYFAAPFPVPVQCVHIGLPETTVLVDAPAYEFNPDSSFALPDYRPPPDLPAQLTAAGLSPEAVEHVIITHAHSDHFNGVTIKRNGRYRPTFPNARCYLGRADWDNREVRAALRRPRSTEARTLGVLHRLDRLQTVDGALDLGFGVVILPAPGETPGHQIVRVQTDGGVLYCVGDLFHHPVEVERPEWTAYWNDAGEVIAGRKRLIQTALAESALITATHIPGFGRLEAVAGRARWVSLDD